MHILSNTSSSAHGWEKSPAEQARKMYDLGPGRGFGRIVSQIARGIYDPTASTDPTANDDNSPGGTGSMTTGSAGDTGESQVSQDGSTDTTQTQIPGTVDMSV